MRKSRNHLIIGLVIGATVLVVLLILNLTTAEKKIKQRIVPSYAVADPQFTRSMGALLGPPLRDGNRVVSLQNGDAIFPPMLAAIRSAEKTICFETYIYWSGKIGKEFADALSEKARAGVKVHVLLDWIGSGKMEGSVFEQMKASGAQIEKYHPLRWYNLGRMNNRTHRKLLIVDGKIGFTGGVGIADKWLGHAQDPEHWRDSHYSVEGPAVAQMQAAFLDNWMKTRGEVLHGEEYFPAIPASAPTAPGVRAQVFKSSSREGSESVRLMYLLSIAAARKSVRLEAAYFVPDDLSLETLVAARRRGVDVEIIVPGTNMDSQVTRKASRSRWGDLLAAGVRIYEFQPTMFHCKVMIVDDLWVSVGSTNFDNRSFRLNDEANLNVYDQSFAREQLEVFEADKLLSKQVTLDGWKRRPFLEKAAEHVTSLFRFML